MRVSRVAPLWAVALSLGLSACSGTHSRRIAAASPAAQRPAASMSGAEKLRRLDIMLMVTALRCRKTSSDFTSDYRRFAVRQMVSLNQAAAELRGGNQAAFDRMSTRMANNYGAGHPWLGCAQLRQVARNLAEVSGRATLEEAAGQLLTRRGSLQLASAQR